MVALIKWKLKNYIHMRQVIPEQGILLGLKK